MRLRAKDQIVMMPRHDIRRRLVVNQGVSSIVQPEAEFAFVGLEQDGELVWARAVERLVVQEGRRLPTSILRPDAFPGENRACRAFRESAFVDVDLEPAFELRRVARQSIVLSRIVLDGELRERVAVLYEGFRSIYGGVVGSEGGFTADELHAIETLMIAVGDGLAVQKLLDPGAVRLDVVLPFWEDVLRLVFERHAAAG